MKRLAVLAVLAASLGGSGAAAHPHAWIDVSVEVLFEPSGQVRGLRETWLFDEFFTADTVQKGERSQMDLLIARILGNLKEWGYFTRVRSGSRTLALGGIAGDQQAALVGQACFQPGMAKITYGTG